MPVSKNYKGELTLTLDNKEFVFHPRTETSQIVDLDTYLSSWFAVLPGVKARMDPYAEYDGGVTGDPTSLKDYIKLAYPDVYTSLEKITKEDIFFLTDGVTDMSGLFSGCTSLTEVDTSAIDTSNVTTFSEMFKDCPELISLIVSHWNTGKVTDISDMFNGDAAITTLDIGNWDTSAVTKAERTFKDCVALENLDLSKWDTSALKQTSGMFMNCTSLTTIGDISNWDLSNLESCASMFNNCQSLTTIGDTSNWDLSKVQNCASMFAGTPNLDQDLDLHTLKTPNTSMLNNCGNGQHTLNLSGIDFTKMAGYTSVGTPKFNTINLSNTKFGTAHKVCFADIVKYATNVNLTGCTLLMSNFEYLFNSSSVEAITGLTTVNWFSNATQTDLMFNNCRKLTSVDLSTLDMSNVTNTTQMFCNCNQLTNVILPTSMPNVTNAHGMFYNCNSLTSVNLSGFDTSKVTNFGSLFELCTYLEDYGNFAFDLSSITAVQSVAHMLSRCNALTTVKFKNVPSSVFADKAALRTAASIPDGCNVVIENFI